MNEEEAPVAQACVVMEITQGVALCRICQLGASMP